MEKLVFERFIFYAVLDIKKLNSFTDTPIRDSSNGW